MTVKPSLAHAIPAALKRIQVDAERVLTRHVPDARCIAQFGTSLHGFSSRVVDIDYLLVASSAPNEAGELEYIKQLRSALIMGSTATRFDMTSNVLRGALLSLCERATTEKVAVRPAFTFGPFPMAASSDHVVTVYLHVNGPISESGFQAFCEHLPYHGSSIIENHRAILGTINNRVSASLVGFDELPKWIDGLERRALMERGDLRRVARKMMHMTCIAAGFASNDPTRFIPYFQSLLDVLEGPSPRTRAYLDEPWSIASVMELSGWVKAVAARIAESTPRATSSMGSSLVLN